MSILASDYRVQLVEESTFADRTEDFSSDPVFLPLRDEGWAVRQQKRLENIQSNLAHPHPHRVAMGRDNTGPLQTLLLKSNRATLMDLVFGGLADGVPSRSKSYAFRTRKGSISGARALGVKCQSLNLVANAGGIVQPNFDLVAAIEEKISTPSIDLPDTLTTPYRFATAHVVLNGAAGHSVRDINLTIANNLLVGPHRTSSLNISYLKYGEQDLTGSVTVLFDSEQYNDLVRGTATGHIYLLFGDALAEHNGTDWNTADYFTADETAILAEDSTLSTETVAIADGALTNLGDTGDVLVQNPILIKLNAVEIPEAPESAGDGRVVQQTLNFEITATADGSAPVECFIDAVSAA